MSEPGLHRWWSEEVATARFPAIAPDGHGIWSSDGQAVGLFLECDQGTENLARLGSKLAGYARLAATGGPQYPVLFWLPSRDREHHVQRLLRADRHGVPVATAVHDDNPAGPVWLVAVMCARVDIARRLLRADASSGRSTARNS